MTGKRWLMAVLGFALLAAAVVEWQRRDGLYWYDTRDGYRYEFGQAGSETVPVELDHDGFVPTAPGIEWETAVLALEVEPVWTGRWFEPALELESGAVRSTHFLDRNAAGRRYLVLHPAELVPGEPVRVSGRHVSWSRQTGEITYFPRAAPEDARVLVLAPHPDDAEIAAFGLYSSRDAYVATVTAGNYVDGRYAELRPDHGAQDTLRGRVRVWDSLVVPTWGGVAPDRIVNLGYWNGSLEALYGTRDGAAPWGAGRAPDPVRYRAGAVEALLGNRVAGPTWGSLVEDLERLLANVRPRVIVAPHPLLDAAPDHQYTTVALLEALDRAGDDAAVLLLYTNHHVLSEYWPFGPSGVPVSLPPWFDDAVRFGGIHSHPLSAADQENKLFALEAMHDLRAAPMILEGGPAERFLTLAGAAVSELGRNPLGTYSYFRRAVRSNELFFVFRPDDRERLSTDVAAGLELAGGKDVRAGGQAESRLAR